MRSTPKTPNNSIVETARGKRPEYPYGLYATKPSQIMPFNSPADPTSAEKPPTKKICPFECRIL